MIIWTLVPEKKVCQQGSAWVLSFEARVTAEDGDDASFSLALSLKHASCRTLKGGEKHVWFYCHVKVRAAIGIFFGAGVLGADEGP